MYILVKPGVRYRDFGKVIEEHAKKNGFSVVRTFCGHGINQLFHCAPNVPHYNSKFIQKSTDIQTFSDSISIRQQGYWYYEGRSLFYYWTHDLWGWLERWDLVRTKKKKGITWCVSNIFLGPITGLLSPLMASVLLNSNILCLLLKLVVKFWPNSFFLFCITIYFMPPNTYTFYTVATIVICRF